MPSFQSDDAEIAYHDEGEGDPVLMIHGFGSSAAVNWVHTSWTKTLREAGRRVVAFDHRGHGKSGKLYDPARYTPEVLADDARRLLDHVQIERADVVGYSMGSRVAAFLALAYPRRVRSLVLGGLGIGLVEGVGEAEPIAAALEAPSADAITGARPKMFRAFAEQTGSDLKALAACMRGSRAVLTPEDLTRIVVPVLVAVGTKDDIAGSPHALASLMPNAEALDIAGRDHMLAVGDKAFKAGVLDFLARRP